VPAARAPDWLLGEGLARPFAGIRDIAIITSPDEMLAQMIAWGIPLRSRIAA
jgi:hypothetical protein